MKYRLKGHESFTLREGWLTKGLKEVKKNSALFSVNSGADALGVGTNMAKSIRYWMKTSGLTKESAAHGCQLTPFGESILRNDPYFEDVFTLWLVHINIATDYENATSWPLFFNRLELSTFNRDGLFNVMHSLFIEYAEDENISERSLRDDCSAILSMYADSTSGNDDPEDKKVSPFAILNLVKKTDKGFSKKQPPLDRLDPLVFLYLITEKLNEEGNLLIDEIVDGDNMPGHILNLNRIMVNEYLDILEGKGYIVINRTAGLDVIYPAEKSLTREEIINAYYEEKKA